MEFIISQDDFNQVATPKIQLSLQNLINEEEILNGCITQGKSNEIMSLNNELDSPCLTPTRKKQVNSIHNDSLITTPKSVATIMHVVTPTPSSSPRKSYSKMSTNIRKLFKSSSWRSIESSWSLLMKRLTACSSEIQIISVLQDVKVTLQEIELFDRINFCKADLENCLKSFSKNKKQLMVNTHVEFVSLFTEYFGRSYFLFLPNALIHDIMQYLDINYFPRIAELNKYFYCISKENEIWNYYYRYKFLRYNPKVTSEKIMNYMEAFRHRFNDPCVGDRVEVAWDGKFRLESSSEIYQGKAWWLAVVIDKHSFQGKYKIHYPGWDHQWDEWVVRSRLRWTVEKNNIEKIFPDDIVEVFCQGTQVPGAWLVTKVLEISEDNLFCYVDVLTTGAKWISRSNIRLVEHNIPANHNSSFRRLSNMLPLPESCSVM